jgi:GNAT superfamily N-acetyltransferase
MPFQNIQQPDFIEINETLRLRKYDGNYVIAIPWYQDELVRSFSEGIVDKSKRLDANYVSRKLSGLNLVGEEYFIEVLENGEFVPIGDVTLKEDDPPIEIGVPKYRGKGIGTKVMQALVCRAREIGIKKIYKEDKNKALRISDQIIKNTYRVLMTRGQKGCYIYCVDEHLQEYFKKRLNKFYKPITYSYQTEERSCAAEDEKDYT